MRFLNKKILFSFFLCSVGLSYSNAQNIDLNAFGYYNEAIRFSQTSLSGTARMQGLAGAGVSLGGDISSAAINPAGLGFYRKSEFSITPGLGFNNSNTSYLGQSTSDSRFNMNVGNLGVVFANPNNGLSINKGGAFSISLTRINDFHNEITYQGVNSESQIVDFFLEQAKGVPWAELDLQGENGALTTLGLAYFTYLIAPNLFEDPGTLDSYVPYVELVPTVQQETIKTTGAQYEWNISYGGNLDDTFYYGVGLGIQTIRYNRERTYEEVVSDRTVPNMTDLLFLDNLNQRGLGLNLKAGVIVRPVDFVRIGLSFTSPTWYRITEAYSEEMYVSYNNLIIPDDFDNDGNVITRRLNDEAAQAVYEDLVFSLQTPLRLNGGLSFFLGKKGFISMDAEYVRYRSASLNNPRFAIDGVDAGFTFLGDNNTISSIFERNSLNIRIGGEFRHKDLRFRGGYAMYQDPQSDSDLIASARTYITGGVGIRKQKYFMDFTIVNEASLQDRQPYTFFTRPNPTANATLSRTRAIFSFGVFF